MTDADLPSRWLTHQGRYDDEIGTAENDYALQAAVERFGNAPAVLRTVAKALSCTVVAAQGARVYASAGVEESQQKLAL